MSTLSKEVQSRPVRLSQQTSMSKNPWCSRARHASVCQHEVMWSSDRFTFCDAGLSSNGYAFQLWTIMSNISPRTLGLRQVCKSVFNLWSYNRNWGKKKSVFLKWSLDLSLPLQNDFFRIMMFIGRTEGKTDTDNVVSAFTPHNVTYCKLFRKKIGGISLEIFPTMYEMKQLEPGQAAHTATKLDPQQQSLQPTANRTGRASRVIP